MEPEGSLPCSQEPSTGPDPEQDWSNPYHPILFLLRSILILWHVNPFLGNARNTRTQQNKVARGTFYVVRIYPLLGNGPKNTHSWQQRRCFTLGPCRGIVRSYVYFPRGGGVEYLHRSPASRRRRRKVKSRIWDSKIWSWVPRDSDSRMSALATASSNCKWQTHPLVREDVI
jgi:hypothetical protein